MWNSLFDVLFDKFLSDERIRFLFFLGEEVGMSTGSIESEFVGI